MIGKTLAHYEITDLLGKGGMGEVYRARDTRLGREVALKMLPAEVAADPERMARFRREAKVLAALNHPNIAGLHGFEEVEGQCFLVMELAEGEDLAAVMQRGAVPVEDAVEIARQIAAGLQEAHERGIVHRDLKPQNVKLTPGGGVKVLDFGLALPQAGPEDSRDLVQSPTITAAMTQAGTILGTAAYMSPEQATGRAVDQRTDIWAFGVILFEMLSGQRLFTGDTAGDILAAVIRAEPRWDELPAGLPRDLTRLLRRCLRKKRQQRLSSMADVRLELEELDGDTAESPRADTVSAWRPRRAWLLPLGIGLVLGAAIMNTADPGSSTSTTGVAPTVVRSDLALPADTQLAGWSSPTVELSPDGSAVAFVAQAEDGQYLYVRRLHEERAVRVPESHGAEGPFFSPDGRWVAFGAGAISGNSDEPRRLKKYSLDTGVTSSVSDLPDYFGGGWREDGTIFFVGVQPLGLWQVSAEGGTPALVGGRADNPPLAWPQVLPGNERALIIVWQGAAVGRLHTIDLQSGALTDLGVDGVFARWTASGHLLVADIERRVWAYRFDAARASVGSGRVQILEEVTLSGNQAAVLAISSTGTLVSSLGAVDGGRRDLSVATWIDENGVRTPLDLEAEFYSGVAISPDGTRVALSIDARELRILDLIRNTQLRLPRGETVSSRRPLWAPDGQAIVFTATGSDGSTGENLFLQATDGVQAPVRLDQRDGEFFPGSWVPGTRQLLHYGYQADNRVRMQIFSVDLDAETPPRVFLDEEGPEATPAVSPDGRWLAYASGESGRYEIFLRSFPDLRRKIPVGTGIAPRWSAQGDKLYFMRRGDRGGGIAGVWVAPIEGAGDDIQPGVARRLMELEGALHWDVDPQSGRHLVCFEVPGAGEIRSLHMVQGFFQELQRVLPVEAP